MSNADLASILRVAFAVFTLGACGRDLSEPCRDPNAAETCGCGSPCRDDEVCVDGLCVESTDKHCGIEQIKCGLAERCIDGMCACDPDLATSVRACGCPAIDCDEVLDHEDACIDGVCTCLPEYHRDENRCGCPPVRCGSGERCVDSACTCQPVDNAYNSANCACEGPCSPEHVCSAGRCGCPQGTVPCAEACVPIGSQCCNGEGDACPAGTTCEFADDGVACRPSTQVPCYNPAYVGSCPQGFTCQLAVDGIMQCHPNGAVACYQDGFYTGLCSAGTQCAPDGGCAPAGWSICGDGSTLCVPGESCMLGWHGWVCRPSGTIACFDEVGVYDHPCEIGWTCHPHLAGCIPPGFTLCDDELTTCPSSTTCRMIVGGLYVCSPNQTNPCYWSNGIFTGWFCPIGAVCDVNNMRCLL